MANGFTQRNQKGDDQEERLKTDILSDFNEYESINREVTVIMGAPLSAVAETKISRVRTLAESVLRYKITPDRADESDKL